MNALWVNVSLGLPDSLVDYPATLARDSIAGALRQVNISLSDVTPQEAVLSAQSKPRVFLFSATSSEWPRAACIASRIRTASPQSLLVLGGHHASALPGSAGMNVFDYVVVGEAEEVIADIAGTAAAERRRSSSFSKPQIIRAKRITALERIPRPLRDTATVRRCRLRGLMFPSPGRQTGAAALLLSRGCNRQCSFCASHLVWGSGLITRPTQPASIDVKTVLDDLRCNALVFVDQAFGEDIAWTRELCRVLRRSDPTPSWYCMAKVTIDRSLVPEMAAAGCTKVGFGVETADPEMRTRLKGFGGEKLHELADLFRACNDVGIVVKAYLMIGFPWETPEYLSGTTTRFLEQLGANELKISYFAPFPGTRDWTTYSNQLVTRDWADFDTVRMPVVYNPQITVQQYHAIRGRLFRAFYGSPTYAEVTRNMLSKFPHYEQSYREFAEYLWTFGMITGQEVWLDWVGFKSESVPKVVPYL